MDAARPGAGRQGRVLPGPVGQAAPGAQDRPDRPGDQRLRMDRGPGPRLPGDPAVLRLSAPVHGPARRPDPAPGHDLKQPTPGGGRWTGRRAGRLGGRHLRRREGGPHVEVVRFDGATDAMTAVAERPDRRHAPGPPGRPLLPRPLPDAGAGRPARSHGYYVIYVRRGDEPLRDALDRGLGRLIESGELRRLYERTGSGPTPSASWPTSPGPLEVVAGRQRRAGWELRLAVRLAAARCRAGDDRAVGRLDAAGDGAGARDRARPAVRPGAGAAAAGRLRRADPRHAADAPALRAVLPAEAAALGRGDRRAGDQLLGLRGRDLPRGAAGDPGRPDGGRAGPGDVAAAGPAAGDRAAGGPDRDPARHERLHRAVQGHVGLLGDHAGRADQAVLDPGQQHRRAGRVRPGDGAAVHGDERAAVVVLAMVRTAAGRPRGRKGGRWHDRGERPGQAARDARGAAGRDLVGGPGRGGGDHRPVGQRQEHVPALPQRPGDVPRGDGDDRRPATGAPRPPPRPAGGSFARSGGGWAWSSRASTSSRTGRCCRT